MAIKKQMNLSEYIRNKLFWAVDRARGCHIRKHVKDLDFCFSDPQEGRKKAQKRLTEFLYAACSTTEFYKDYAGKELAEFPVIQKRTIKENYDAFISNAYDRSKLLTTTTSGSYGMPFTFYLTTEKDARNKAEVIYFSKYAGFEVGMKFAQIRAQKRSWLTRFMQNFYIMNPCIIDEHWLVRQRALFREKGVKFIIGYPSAIVPVVEYCRGKGDGPQDFSVIGIITSAEPYTGKVRQSFKDIFGCIVLDRYSSNEIGTISHELYDDEVHYTNFATQKIELLEMDSDEPVTQPGRIGRVIVTDMFSHAMPLIRYDTGDLATWAAKEKCRLDIPAFEKIEGRVVETLYSPEGKMINFSAIDIIPKYFNDIIQFQFIQKTKDQYVVKLHVLDNFDQEEKLLANCRETFGPNANFTVEYVDSLDPLASGKRPYVINEYKRKS